MAGFIGNAEILSSGVLLIEEGKNVTLDTNPPLHLEFANAADDNSSTSGEKVNGDLFTRFKLREGPFGFGVGPIFVDGFLEKLWGYYRVTYTVTKGKHPL